MTATGRDKAAGGALALTGGRVSVAAAPSDGQAVEGRRWEGIAYSGGKFGQPYGEVVLDLATMQLPEPGRRLPSRYNHSKGERVGWADTFKITHRGLEVGGGFLKNERTVALLADLDNGYPLELSAISEFKPEFIPAGKSVSVNGQTFEGPFILGHNARLRAIEHVEVGADYGAVVERVAASLDTSTLIGGQAMAEDMSTDTGADGDSSTKPGEAVAERMVDIDTLTIDQLREMRPDLLEAPAEAAAVDGEENDDDDDKAAAAADQGGDAPPAVEDDDMKKSAAASVAELRGIDGIEPIEIVTAIEHQMTVATASAMVDNRRRVQIAGKAGAGAGATAPPSGGVGDAAIDGDGGGGVTVANAYDASPTFAKACLAKCGGDEARARKLAATLAQNNIGRGLPADHLSFAFTAA